MITLRPNRVLNFGQRVEVFLTDDRTMFCLRHPKNKQTLATGNNFVLTDVQFVIDEELQKQFHKRGAKTTHAWLEGTLQSIVDGSSTPPVNYLPVKYNPHKNDTFIVGYESPSPVHKALSVYCLDGKLYGLES